MPRYYVYQLVDPITNEAFYIGKGCGRRAWAHLYNRNDSSNFHKRRRIESIRADGNEPKVEILQGDLTESDALALERDLIAQHRASLTNISPGHRLPFPRGFGDAFKILSFASRLLPREQIPLAELDNYDRLYSELLEMMAECISPLMGKQRQLLA